MSIKHLNDFDYAEFLKRRFMVGQVDPWRKTDEGKPIFTILVPIETAIAECKEWSNQEIGRQEFINYLKLNDILCFRNIDEFQSLKTELRSEIDETPKKLKKRVITEERKKQLQEHIKKVRPPVY